MDNLKIEAAKILYCCHSDNLKSIVESIPHFKCYGCIEIKLVSDFGKFYDFQDFNQLRSFAVCRTCCNRIEAIQDELIRLTKIHLTKQNALREIYPPDSCPKQVHGKEQDVWEISYKDEVRNDAK